VLLRSTARLTSVATLGLGAGLLIAAPALLALFGPGFAASFNVLAVLVCGAVVQSAFGPAEDCLNMLGAERMCALISLGALGLAMVLNLLLIPWLGVIGGAIAMALAGAARALMLSLAARLRLGLATHVLA
jgi:O-antigen/teichoic acid export membrane protein